MACRLCGNSDYLDILKKTTIPIWTGSSEIKNEFYSSHLKQCTKCGHVYEDMSPELSDKLINIYESAQAQASTQTGDGNWGLKRAEFFLNKINYKKYNSAIEIGCANGFLLKFLEDYGYKQLIGIDPSIENHGNVGKIELIRDFVNEKTLLNCKVDLIFSNAVFEHIEHIHGVLKFCKNHLNKNGELFFAVPNAQIDLEKNDPALFIHEHVHYYTSDSIKYLLSSNGFHIKSIVHECNAIYVSAILNSDTVVQEKTPTLYNEYSKMLDIRLSKFDKVMSLNKNVIIHGANNKLNNILGWLNNKYSFTLVDNDEKKYGKYFFEHKVQKLQKLQNLNNYDSVVVIPTCFFEEIKSEYVKLGFRGNFYDA